MITDEHRNPLFNFLTYGKRIWEILIYFSFDNNLMK